MPLWVQVAVFCLACVTLGAALWWYRDSVESALRWLAAYPLYPAQVAVVMLIASGGLGAELGAERLFWHEDRLIQFWVGLFVGLLVLTVLLMEFILNPPNRVTTWLGRLDHRVSLFPWPQSRNAHVRRLGRYLVWGAVCFLLAILGMKLVAAASADPVRPNGTMAEMGEGYLGSRWWLLPFVGGYAAALALGWGLFVLDERWFRWHTGNPGDRRTVRVWLVRARGGWLNNRLRRLRVRPNRRAVHGVTALVAVLAVGVATFLGLLALVLDYVWPFVGREALSVGSPVFLFASAMILVSLAYGALAFYFHRQLVIVGSGILALVAYNSTLLFYENNYKYRFPGMTYRRRTPLWNQAEYEAELKKAAEKATKEGAGSLTPSKPVQVPRLVGDAYLTRVLPGTAAYAETYLLPPWKPLAAMRDRWHRAYPGQKPRVVFIATSGGGIRAAVWTGVVLEHLDASVRQELPQDKLSAAQSVASAATGTVTGVGPSTTALRDHIRMITGASGGMVGAALYAADFENYPVPGNAYVDVLSADSLTRPFQSLLTRDLLLNTLAPPGVSTGWDRGQTLEWKWGVVARERLRRNPFARTFAELWAKEATGERPSLVFSPMMIEDSRRLLVSNLNLADLTAGRVVAADPARGTILGCAAAASSADDRLTLSAVEFHRLFPDVRPPGWEFATSEGFTVGTAARMSATFPVISPAVSLPTDPPRRLVDAGYYDNYGVNLAATWLLRNQHLVEEYTSGVALVEIRAFPLTAAGKRFAATDDQTGRPTGGDGRSDLFSDAVGAVSAPMDAVLRARSNTSYNRNAELVEELHRVFNQPGRSDFFLNVAFELDRPASLNWFMTGQERKDIVDTVAQNPDKTIAQGVAQLKLWFGTGGR